MDKVNKQELRRLIESGRYQVQPWTALALLDELEENDGVIAVWRGRTQRAEAELEQYRKDAERVEFMANKCGEFHVKQVVTGLWASFDTSNGMHCYGVDYPDSRAAIDAAMAKEGGANG